MTNGITKVQVGYLVTITVMAGSFFRPLAGYIADRIGGMKFLLLLITSIMMACLGMGNGSVFQLVPQRFPKEISVITGIVGAAGGFGGYLLSNHILGPLKQSTGTHVSGFITVTTIVLIITIVFSTVSINWRKTWATANKGVNF